MPACLLILTLDQAVTQYGQLLFGIFNLSIVTGKLSIVSNHIDNIFQIVKYLLTDDLRYTSCSCLPPYSLYVIPSMIWPLPGECIYQVLPTYWEIRRRLENCQGLRNLLNTGKKSLYSTTWIFLLTKRIMIFPDVYLFDLNMWII